jgi:hypothetical protein
VGLHEDAVDDVDIDGALGGADGFDEAADAEVAGLAEDAVGGTDDEVDGGWGEGVVAEPGVVEFAEDELAHGVGIDRLAQNVARSCELLSSRSRSMLMRLVLPGS